MFIRQLKRRDESGHAVFHMQDSRKATQGYILVWNTGKRNAHAKAYRSAYFSEDTERYQQTGIYADSHL